LIIDKYQLGLKITDNEFLTALNRRIFARIKGTTIEFEDIKYTVLQKFMENHEKLKKHPNIKAWIALVVKNLVIDIKRSHNYSRTSTFSANEGIEERLSNSQSNEIMKNIELDQVINFLNSETFSENDRLVFNHRVEGLSFNEIAEILDISVSNARKICSRVRIKLHKWKNS
tara:strand:+ start:608 stop:1123 length:516 start_codon:yes stop_codon:yes gene_type:complete